MRWRHPVRRGVGALITALCRGSEPIVIVFVDMLALTFEAAIFENGDYLLG